MGACAVPDAGPPKPLRKVPAWHKRPVAVHMGFGGKLVCVTNAAAHLKQGPEPQHSAQTARIDMKQAGCPAATAFPAPPLTGTSPTSRTSSHLWPGRSCRPARRSTKRGGAAV